jgi:tRNA-modifying protein YgfZ
MSATTSFEAEYELLTTGAGLLDRSERGKLALSGTDAKEFLNGQITQELNELSPGRGAYAAFLTQKGKMLGDLRVLDSGDELLLDTERPALQELFNMIRRYSLGYRTELHKRTVECGLLSLIGPQSDSVLRAAAAAVPSPAEHDHRACELASATVRVIRTDLGVDVLTAAADLDAVRSTLLEAGAVAVGDDAAECVRIEHGRPRYAIDLDDSVIPQEAGLNPRAVSFTKGCYVGQETVARLYYKGKPNRELRGLRSDAPLALGTVLTLPASGDDQLGRELGTVTSSALSPRYGAVALALVRREAPVGTIVDAGRVQAEVVALPFGPS